MPLIRFVLIISLSLLLQKVHGQDVSFTEHLKTEMERVEKESPNLTLSEIDSISSPLYDKAKAAGNMEALKQWHFHMASVMFIKKEYDLLLDELHSLLNEGLPLTLEDSVRIYSDLRSTYVFLQAYEGALDAHYEYHRMSKPFVSDFEHLVDNDPLAAILLHLGRQEEAIEMYKYIIRELNKRGHKSVTAMYTNDVGYAHEVMEEMDSARAYYRLALKIAEDRYKMTKNKADSNVIGIILGNLAEMKMRDGVYSWKVGDALLTDIKYSIEFNDPVNAIKSILDVSGYYEYYKKIDSAYYWLNKGEELAREINLQHWIGKILMAKAGILAKMGQEDTAYYLLRRSVTIADSIRLNEAKLKALGLQYAHDLETKDIQLQEQTSLANLASQRAEAEAQRNRFILIVLILISAIAVMMVAAFFQRIRQLRLLKSKNTEIEEKNVVIQDSLKEKNALLSEIHHRVKNNMQVISSLLDLQSRRNNDPNFQRAILEGQKRIHAMALIHQKLYQTDSFSSVSFEDYVKDLVGTLLRTYSMPDKRVETKLNIEPVNFNMDTAIPLGLILNELISNSLKYAFSEQDKPVISILLKDLSGGRCFIKISDNGKGLPDDRDWRDLDKIDSLGIKLVRTLVKQLNGELELSSTSRGLSYLLQFKEKK